MNQRAITLYLARKGLSPIESRSDLVPTLGPELVSYPSVTHYLRQAKFETLKSRVLFVNPNRSLIIQITFGYSP
jgi:hypothetical protein